MKINLDFMVTPVRDSEEEWVPATVPGAVQLDWAKAHDLPSWWKEEHYKDYRWMEDAPWCYKATLSWPNQPGQRVFLVCGGVDYQYRVCVGGELRYVHEGMFTPFELDVTEDAGKELVIGIAPAPHLPGMPDDRCQASQSVKPAVSYGWDWHPRLVPLGIWEDTFLEVRDPIHLTGFETLYTLNDNRSTAIVTTQVKTSGETDVLWELIDPAGHVVVHESGPAGLFTARVDHPRLWWPNGHGEAALYTSRVTLKGESRSQRIGFRTLRLVMAKGQWEQPDGFPKGRSNPPITLEVNGRSIFAKGTNWVNPEVFPGIMNRKTYDAAVEPRAGCPYESA